MLRCWGQDCSIWILEVSCGGWGTIWLFMLFSAPMVLNRWNFEFPYPQFLQETKYRSMLNRNIKKLCSLIKQVDESCQAPLLRNHREFEKYKLWAWKFTENSNSAFFFSFLFFVAPFLTVPSLFFFRYLINSFSAHFRAYWNPFSFVPSFVHGDFLPEKLSSPIITELCLTQKRPAKPPTLGWVHSGSDTRNLEHQSGSMFRRSQRTGL